jgi:hypothetical protein
MSSSSSVNLLVVARSLVTLPRGLLGSLAGGGGSSGSSPLGGGGSGTPLVTGSAVPAGTGGTSEASGGSLPVTTSTSEAGLDGSGALLLNAGGLLLLDLLLGLGLGVAVCDMLVDVSRH